MDKYLIIDGNSIINRAFYAIKLLTNKHGVFTNGIYGFMNILFKNLEVYNPKYVSVAFDLKGPTFRHKKYDKYKAQRKGMPDELAVQMPILKEILNAMNIKIYQQEGYEADDIIGTVSRVCDEKGIECLILTGDKDDLQLASKTTKVLLTITKGGSTDTATFDEKAVYEKYGVSPIEFIDVKALMGDTSDNIPGVKGIGEKSAFSLISKFKSIDNIYENIDSPEIKNAARNKLVDDKDMAYLSRELATIDRYVPGSFDIEGDILKEYDTERLSELFKNLEFNVFLKKLNAENESTPESKNSLEFLRLESCEELEKYISQIKDSLIYRIYRTGTDFTSFAFLCGNNAVYITKSLASGEEKIMECLKPIFENNTIMKISTDIKDDMVLLNEYGIHFTENYFDISVGAYILNAARNNYDLSSISQEFLSMPVADINDILGKGKSRKSIEEIDQHLIIDIVRSEINAIEKLKEYEIEKITQQGQEHLLYDIELPLVNVLSSMQINGFMIDEKELLRFGDKISKRLAALESEIYAHAGEEFNIGSPKQLGVILFEKLGLKAIKKTKTGYSTDVEVLEKLKKYHPIIECIIEYRQNAKLKSTYVDGLIAVMNVSSKKIHSNFKQTVVVTGRISSTEPNLQNIPMRQDLGREIRKMFVPQSDDYVLVDADYSQIELRILAHIAGDENMIKAFKDGEDIHLATAMNVFNVRANGVTPLLRSRAKAINFGIMYGMGSFALSQDLKISVAEAKEYIENYFSKYPKVKKYLDDCINHAKENGYVTTLFNRRRYIPEINSSNFMLRSSGERIAMNTPIQGTAADIIKIAMVSVYNELKNSGLKSKLILQVHDELIIETHKDEIDKVKELLIRSMESAADLKVPIDVDCNVGASWYDAK